MIAYASRTGNVRFIYSQLGLPGMEINEQTAISEPFLLLTYTDGLGQVPPLVQRFMDKHGMHCKGVAASGNRNFGHHHFARAGDTIATQWNIPLIRKIELRGFPADYEAIRRFYLEQVVVHGEPQCRGSMAVRKQPGFANEQQREGEGVHRHEVVLAIEQ